MATVKIYGASDDLIEVEGDLDEEFYASEGENHLAFSDGTVLSVVYDEQGIWRISPAHQGSGTLQITQCDGTDDSVYSDVATLEGESIAWVAFGTNIAKS